jgi:SAM-dependent methyltransferase
VRSPATIRADDAARDLLCLDRKMFRALARRVLGNLRVSQPDTDIPKPRDEVATPGELRRLDKDLRVLTSELQEMRRELRGRLLQYHHELGRLTKVVDGKLGHEAGDAGLSGRAVPQECEDEHSLEWGTIGEAHPDPDGREWRRLDRCPACGHDDWTIVDPWNKFILTAKAPDDTSAQYDYAVCHACGILFASRRPGGARYRFLLAHFGEVTAKRGGGAEISNRVLNPYPLDDADRAELRRLAGPGIYVSDHLGLRNKDYLLPLLRDRLDSSVHVDILGALVQPRGARVLEIRSRSGAILDGLRRAWDARVFAMPIWESQQFILREILDIPTSDLIDFERFSIPFEGPFDLIVCNHMLTHALAPTTFLAEVRRCLAPGGHIYLHAEPDDAEFLDGNQSMFATLNPLHMQAFDQRSLIRALEANGFDTVFVKGRNLQHLLLARASTEPRAMKPMKPRERDERIERYHAAFHRAILGVDESVRTRVSAHWAAAVEGAVASGVAQYDERGQVRLVAR